MVRRGDISAVALRHAGGDRTCMLICGDEIDRLGHCRLSRLNVRCRVALKGRRALDSQRGEATDESNLLQDVLRMPGIVHVAHEKSWFTLGNQSVERLGNALKLPHSWRYTSFHLVSVQAAGEMGRSDKNRLL